MGETVDHVIQYGTHHARKYVCVGIKSESKIDDGHALEMFEHLDRHATASNLAIHCELNTEVPKGSHPHILMTLHHFEGPPDEAATIVQAKMATLGYIATIDPIQRVLWPDIGLFPIR